MELNAAERKLQILYQLYPEAMCAEMSPGGLEQLLTRLDGHIEDGLLLMLAKQPIFMNAPAGSGILDK